MRTKTVTAASAIPVLIPATVADQEGVVVTDTLLPPFLVRGLKTDVLDHGRFSQSFRNAEGRELVAEKEEFVAVVELIEAYKLRMHPSRRGEWKRAWKEALRKYEGSIFTYKETKLLPEDEKKRREFGRQLIEIVVPACGLDLGTKSPERAADLWDGYFLLRSAKSNPQLLLGRIISNHLHQVRVVLWFSQGRLQPALYCGNERDAFYVRTMLSLNERKGWAVCPYSRCGKVFEQSRPDQECCSTRHTNAHRIAVWRTTSRGRRAMKNDSERRKRKSDRARNTKNRQR